MFISPRTWILFLRVLKRERRKISWIHLAKSLLRFKTSIKIWGIRLDVCSKCPIYDHGFKSCRMPKEIASHLGYGDRDLGCGCFMPLRALDTDACWGWVAYERKIGWPQSAQSGR